MSNTDKSVVIAEKSSQAKDIIAAIGLKHGQVLAAQGHLLVLEEPVDVNPDWSTWAFDVLRPAKGHFDTKPDPDPKPGCREKLAAIKKALAKADRVVIATDCDREGQLIGDELLEHYGFKGRVERALFTATDRESIRKAFGALKPNADFRDLYLAGWARQQCDQIHNLTLTRAASLAIKPDGIEGALGIGRVKTPTLGIVCKRELEIVDFVAREFFHVVAAIEGGVELRHEPELYGDKEQLTDRKIADAIMAAADGFAGPLVVKTERKRRGPPPLFDLPRLQKTCGSRFGWSADDTLAVAQELYDGAGKKAITYPRAEARYLAESQMAEVPVILDGLEGLDAFADLMPADPVIRKGKGGHFSDAGLAGVSHHAIIPNANVMDDLPAIWGRLSERERKMFDLVARQYIAALTGDWIYDQTTATVTVPKAYPADAGGYDAPFRAIGNVTVDVGWKRVLPGRKDDDGTELPTLTDGSAAMLANPRVDAKRTQPPPRYNEGTLIEAMSSAWKFLPKGGLQERLKEAKGIGTPATRAEVIKVLKQQKQLTQQGKHVVPTPAGMAVYKTLLDAAPELVDPAVTAQWEMVLDEVAVGKIDAGQIVDSVTAETGRIMKILEERRPAGAGGPSEKMSKAAQAIAREKGLDLPGDCLTDYAVCRTFLDQHMEGGRGKSKKGFNGRRSKKKRRSGGGARPRRA